MSGRTTRAARWTLLAALVSSLVTPPAPARAAGAQEHRPAAAAQEPPPRALWVVRNTLDSPAETERAIQDCAAIGCGLIFLQVSGRWDAYFPSGIFPAGRWWSAEGDNVARAIELAHARGIRVHAWVNAFLAWSADERPRDPDHVLLRHPEWFLVGPDGRSMLDLSRRELDRARLEGYFLEPRIPAVRTELRRFVLEVVTRYPELDGVHLDYVRLPSAAWGFQPELRAAYARETGVEPLELYIRERALVAERGAEWLARARVRWQAWHREGVTQLVRLVAGDLRAVRPGLELSAAVLANPASARDDFGQDWASWLEEGTLDLAVPMAYGTSAAGVLELLERIDGSVQRRARVYAGVSLEFLPASEVAPIEALMGRYGADGLAIFSYNLLRADRRAVLRLSGRSRGG